MGVVVLVVAAFFAGQAYARTGTAGAQARGANAGGFRGAGGRAGMGGFVTGEIILKDATSITVKMQDGSTKIVLLGTSTPVLKSTLGTDADLVNGANVAIMGAANSDGSVTAQSVQIRPAGMTGPRFNRQAGTN